MMGIDMGVMAIVMVIVAIIVVGGIVAAVYLGVRAVRAPAEGEVEDSARAALDRRLAQGEISSDEYYERESALRSGEPSRNRRGR
jgi:uncharacterized membrane protein